VSMKKRVLLSVEVSESRHFDGCKKGGYYIRGGDL
jgi:hypothetical protein